MRKITFCFLGILLVWGCTTKEQQNKGVLKEKTFSEAKELQISDSVEIEETFNLLSWKITANNICFVTSGLTDDFVSVYSYPTCEKQYDYGKIGQGPNEFITLNCGDAKEDMLLYDIMARKLELLYIGNDSLKISKILPLYNDKDGVCKPFTFISHIRGDKYLMKVDEVEASSWEIADLGKKEILHSFDNPIRKENMSYTPFDFIQCVNDSALAVAYKYMDRIELYSIVNDKIELKCALGSDKDQSDEKSYNNLICYYLSVIPYSESFFCLKSSDGNRMGNVIEVYDLNGECKLKYTLSKSVSSINIDKKGCIVGYVQDLDKTILYKFER